MQSEKLKDGIYGVPWEHMDIKTRKIVMIFLINVQEPIYVQALGLAAVNLTNKCLREILLIYKYYINLQKYTFSQFFRFLKRRFLITHF